MTCKCAKTATACTGESRVQNRPVFVRSGMDPEYGEKGRMYVDANETGWPCWWS